MDDVHGLIAASQVMQEHLNEFQDLGLALIAYNGGGGWVRDAIALAKQDGHTFFNLETTRAYIGLTSKSTENYMRNYHYAASPYAKGKVTSEAIALARGGYS